MDPEHHMKLKCNFVFFFAQTIINTIISIEMHIIRKYTLGVFKAYVVYVSPTLTYVGVRFYM